MNRPRQTSSPQPQRGFTLLELTLSTFIMVLIFGGLQSAVLIATRAADQPGAPLPSLIDAQRGIDTLCGDLACATAVSVHTANSISFTVPDRTGDGVPDTIAYTWSGTSGAVLTRTINGTAETVVPNVRLFKLSYDTMQKTDTATYSTSAESLLASNTSGLTSSTFQIKQASWIGEYVKPSLPSNATSWNVTRVDFVASNDGPANGSVRVQIRNASGGIPTTVVDETSLLESSLTGGYAWQEVSFTNAINLSVNSGMCMVFQWQSDAVAADIDYQTLTLTGSATSMVTTSNQGASWSTGLTTNMFYQVYGTYNTANVAATHTLLSSVRIDLATGDVKTPTLHTAARTINQPELF